MCMRAKVLVVKDTLDRSSEEGRNISWGVWLHQIEQSYISSHPSVYPTKIQSDAPCRAPCQGYKEGYSRERDPVLLVFIKDKWSLFFSTAHAGREVAQAPD